MITVCIFQERGTCWSQPVNSGTTMSAEANSGSAPTCPLISCLLQIYNLPAMKHNFIPRSESLERCVPYRPWTTGDVTYSVPYGQAKDVYRYVEVSPIIYLHAALNYLGSGQGNESSGRPPTLHVTVHEFKS